MEYPYCTVDGVDYQLVFSELGTLRFPDIKEYCLDLNKLYMDYVRGTIPLQVLWEEYTKTGSSYELVQGYFTVYGTNSHTVSQGNGEFKTMVLHSGDPEIDASYNYSEDEVKEAETYATIEKLYNEYHDMDKKDVIELLTECTTKLKSII